jgi:hypothetical protein
MVLMPRRAPSSADLAHGEDLAGQVGDVAEVQDLRARRDRAFESRSARSSIDGGGTGNEIFVSVMPSRRTRCSHVSSMRP